MRLRHFCIGSIRTQDLLISKSFLPLAAPEEQRDIQKVWASFLDLFQAEQRWTPFLSQLHPDRDVQQHPQSQPATRNPSLSRSSPTAGTSTTGAPGPHGEQQHHVAKPLFTRDCCFIYKAMHDIVLVACCPLPPTPSTASSTVTRIPLSLPGQQQRSLSVSSTGSQRPDLTSSISSLKSDTASTRQQKPDLAFSTATGLHVSPHGMIEFLSQLIKALERYLLNGFETVNTSSRRTSTSSARNATVPKTTLSADMIQLNTGVVYEILEECMELGYPMMPSLAQLDLLVFGVAKTS